MIELIFVIVIIGILAAVAIPKLAANKDDATAATCNHEIGQYISEVSQAYAASPDYATWSGTANQIDVNITNIRVGTTEGNGLTVAAATKIDTTAVSYMCDSEVVAVITASGDTTTGAYNITVNPEAVAGVDSPAAKKLINALTKQYGSTNDKVFRL